MKQFYQLSGFGVFFLTLFWCSTAAHATHIRAGEIIARRLDPQSLSYEITIRGYVDRTSQVIFGSNGTIDFGDGTTRQLTNTGDPGNPDYIPREAISDDTWMYEYKVEHTYPAVGNYKVSFREFYRTPDILNMDNSVNMPFYIVSAILIDPFLGANATPEFTKPPVDIALRGKTYHHQPGTWDPDGDSLSYQLVYVKQDKNQEVANYRFPHVTFPAGDPRNGTSEAGATPLFKINPISGDLIWDAPGTTGEYNIAFQVTEWRKMAGKYQQLGFVTRDMLIIVAESDEGLSPQLAYPIADTFISPAAGEQLSWTISATAPSADDSVVLELWGDFSKRTDAIISSTAVREKGEATITIQWTAEAHAGQHYQLIARAYDPSRPALSRNRSTYIFYNPTQPLGIKPLSHTTINVFPNPVTDRKFMISLPEAADRKLQLQVYDIQGKLVLQELRQAGGAEQPVLLPEVQKGMYLLLVQYNGKLYRNKLVVQ